MWPFKKKMRKIRRSGKLTPEENLLYDVFGRDSDTNEGWLKKLPPASRRTRVQLRIEYNCNNDMAVNKDEQKTNAISVIIRWSKERNPEPTPNELMEALKDFNEKLTKMCAKGLPKNVDLLMEEGELVWNVTERIET